MQQKKQRPKAARLHGNNRIPSELFDFQHRTTTYCVMVDSFMVTLVSVNFWQKGQIIHCSLSDRDSSECAKCVVSGFGT